MAKGKEVKHFKEVITTREAIEIAESNFGIRMTVPTVIKYTKVNKLGYQLGGNSSPWNIYKDDWVNYLSMKMNPAETVNG
jgi:hypothetical protein